MTAPVCHVCDNDAEFQCRGCGRWCCGQREWSGDCEPCAGHGNVWCAKCNPPLCEACGKHVPVDEPLDMHYCCLCLGCYTAECSCGTD